MSLAIVFKGAEGIVLAADSRVTLTAVQQLGGKDYLLPSTYDNATKLLSVTKQAHVAVVTYGLGAIGTEEPRTAHSYLPEFESQLRKDKPKRLTVEQFASKLSDFFMAKWTVQMPADYKDDDMVFMIGGYDEGGVYGRLFELRIPSKPTPIEHRKGNDFGLIWGGQKEYTSRLLNGFDESLTAIIENELKPPDGAGQDLVDAFGKSKTAILESFRRLGTPIPYQFLPLQDAVDLCISLIRTTITLQKWQIGIRGVGGSIDVAMITQKDGFQSIQQKKVKGE